MSRIHSLLGRPALGDVQFLLQTIPEPNLRSTSSSTGEEARGLYPSCANVVASGTKANLTMAIRLKLQGTKSLRGHKGYQCKILCTKRLSNDIHGILHLPLNCTVPLNRSICAPGEAPQCTQNPASRYSIFRVPRWIRS